MDKNVSLTITNVACFDISNNDDLPLLNEHIIIELGVLLSVSQRSVTDFGRLVFTFSRLKRSTDINRSPTSGDTSLISAITDNIFLNNVFCR